MVYWEEKLGARSGPADEVAEHLLIDAAIGGGVQPFATLYDRYVDRVYSYVYHRLGNQAETEDLTQQVFLQAWRAIGRYQQKATPFAAWLLRIAHNLVVSHYRRARENIYLDLEPESEARWADPEAEAFAEVDREAVRQAIRRLKPQQQQVIVMRFMEHFDYAEIASILGKSEGNVRVMQHRALSELRRLLSSEVER
ncbi:MAG: sigma-70 family RNA polymerase sigma factor [Chloroflexi bacterium]|nr:sigma-70 family RNA polymerase sigma factor [Chloroflexota bacterium]